MKKDDRKKSEIEAFEDISLYQELMERPYTRALKEEVHKEVRKFSSLIEEGKILEVGAGVSEFREDFNEKSFYVATDLTHALLVRNPRTSVGVVCDGEFLSFKDRTFDVLLFIGVLHHLTNQLKALEEGRRVLRKGGLIFICEPHRASLNIFYFLLRHIFMRTFGVGAVRKLIGCFSPGETHIDKGAIGKVFNRGYRIDKKTILSFRLPPLRFFKHLNWDVVISRFLDRVPPFEQFGTTILIEIEENSKN